MSGLKESCDLFFGTSDIYKVFGLDKNATDDEVKKAYRKLSLRVHPDRVADEDKENATEKFKVLGKIHAILSDKERRAVYDDTGCLDEFDTGDLNEKDWYSYWRLLFKNVTEEDISAYEVKYKGSDTELEDLKSAYEKSHGDMDEILSRVPYSSPDDEPRLRKILQTLIHEGKLPDYKAFSQESPNKRRLREKKYEQEAKRAKKVMQGMKKKEKSKKEEENIEMDSLSALISKNRKTKEAQADAFFKHLEEKYTSGSKKKTGRKAK